MKMEKEHKIKWQYTEEQNEYHRPLFDLQKEYAKKVVDFINSLSKEHRRFATYEAMDVSYELCFAVGDEDDFLTYGRPKDNGPFGPRKKLKEKVGWWEATDWEWNNIVVPISKLRWEYAEKVAEILVKEVPPEYHQVTWLFAHEVGLYIQGAILDTN